MRGEEELLSAAEMLVMLLLMRYASGRANKKLQLFSELRAREKTKCLTSKPTAKLDFDASR